MIYPGTPYVTVMSEDFEDTEFSWWARWSRGTEAYWGISRYRPHAGANPAPYPPPSGNSGYSVYCANTGSAGVAAPGPYPGNMEGWAIYGTVQPKNTLLAMPAGVLPLVQGRVGTCTILP